MLYIIFTQWNTIQYNTEWENFLKNVINSPYLKLFDSETLGVGPREGQIFLRSIGDSNLSQMRIWHVSYHVKLRTPTKFLKSREQNIFYKRLLLCEDWEISIFSKMIFVEGYSRQVVAFQYHSWVCFICVKI